jgi:hypothetical protein
MADNNLNTQLQALHARLDRVDDDLVAHYAGISRLVIALAANPYTAGSAAPSLVSYNMSSAGQTLVKKMLNLIPGYDTFKKLQHIGTADLLGGISSKLAGLASNIESTLTSAITNAVTDAATAASDLAAAVAGGAAAETIASLTSAKNAADSLLSSLNNSTSALGGFMSTINDIASGKTVTATFKK